MQEGTKPATADESRLDRFLGGQVDRKFMLATFAIGLALSITVRAFIGAHEASIVEQELQKAQKRIDEFREAAFKTRTDDLLELSKFETSVVHQLGELDGELKALLARQKN